MLLSCDSSHSKQYNFNRLRRKQTQSNFADRGDSILFAAFGCSADDRGFYCSKELLILKFRAVQHFPPWCIFNWLFFQLLFSTLVIFTWIERCRNVAYFWQGCFQSANFFSSTYKKEIELRVNYKISSNLFPSIKFNRKNPFLWIFLSFSTAMFNMFMFSSHILKLLSMLVEKGLIVTLLCIYNFFQYLYLYW